MDPHLLLASQALDRGNGARALSHLDSVTDFSDPEVFRLRAAALISSDRFAEAEDSARRGLELAPGNRLLQMELARSLSNQDKNAEAERVLITALNQAPENLPLLTQYAWLLAHSGDAVGAHAVMDRIPGDVLNGHPSTLALQGYVALIEGRQRSARQFLNQGMAMDPESVSTRMLLALENSLDDKPRSSADNMLAAAMLDPEMAGEYGREARYIQHPLLAPARLIGRIGPAKLWLAFIVVIYLGPQVWPGIPLGPILVAYFALVIYSWTVPWLLRRWMIFRGQL